jgi:hypothetical protein
MVAGVPSVPLFRNVTEGFITLTHATPRRAIEKLFGRHFSHETLELVWRDMTSFASNLRVVMGLPPLVADLMPLGSPTEGQTADSQSSLKKFFDHLDKDPIRRPLCCLDILRRQRHWVREKMAKSRTGVYQGATARAAAGSDLFGLLSGDQGGEDDEGLTMGQEGTDGIDELVVHPLEDVFQLPTEGGDDEDEDEDEGLPAQTQPAPPQQARQAQGGDSGGGASAGQQNRRGTTGPQCLLPSDRSSLWSPKTFLLAGMMKPKLRLCGVTANFLVDVFGADTRGFDTVILPPQGASEWGKRFQTVLRTWQDEQAKRQSKVDGMKGE